MEARTIYFERPGWENTEEVLRTVKRRAAELGIRTVLVATTRGDTAVKATEALEGLRLVAVTHSHGFREPDTQELTAENRRALESRGATILTTAHTFAGLSRALRNKTSTVTIGDLTAHILRIFGEGMKVVVEIATMAADAGLVRTDEAVISVAGTGRGADTAVVLKPINSQRFFDMKVKEILCKPHF